MPTHHEIPCTPDTVHWGVFDAALPSIRTIAPGDTVTMHCISGGPETLPPPPFMILPEHTAIHARHQRPVVAGHILTGPLHVEGAEPGDTLEVRIQSVRPRQDWGYNRIVPLAGTLPEDFPISRMWHIAIDREAMSCTLPWGTELPLRPFCGVMGVAPPPLYGRLNTLVPREFGGNLDNKELIDGSTLFLPVFVEGAKFSAGDGHGLQGDGEVNVTALETAVTATFEFHLHKRTGQSFPRAETPTHLISMGLNEDLDQAARQALREMITLICERTNLDRPEAYALCSLAADFRVTQLVDGNKGIHGMLPKTALGR